MKRRIIGALGVWLLPIVAIVHTPDADATPSQIIVLRHGEKQDAYRLCEVGVQRSLALAAQYLGKGAKDSLFAKAARPTLSSRSRCTRSNWSARRRRAGTSR